MNRFEIRRQTLRATAKLTLFFAVAGCSGKTDEGAPTEAKDSSATDVASDVATDGAKSETSPADAPSDAVPTEGGGDASLDGDAEVVACGVTRPPAATVTDAQKACCDGIVKASVPVMTYTDSIDPAKAADERAKAGPDGIGCCEALIVFYGTSAALSLGEDRWGCCAILDEDFKKSTVAINACTPWGPPVPPKMDWNLA